FETEPDDTFATAPDTAGTSGVLGAMTPGNTYQASAQTFAFEDISGTGTILGLDGADDSAVTIPIGFSFPFFGTNQTQIGVSSNGLLTFGGTDTSFTNADLTTSPNLAGIAPYWDDLFITGGANTHVFSQVLGVGPNQHLTVQWNS